MGSTRHPTVSLRLRWVLWRPLVVVPTVLSAFESPMLLENDVAAAAVAVVDAAGVVDPNAIYVHNAVAPQG